MAVSLAVQLGLLQKRLDLYRAKIAELFDQHPDRDLFGSPPAWAKGWGRVCWQNWAMTGLGQSRPWGFNAMTGPRRSAFRAFRTCMDRLVLSPGEKPERATAL